MRPFRTYINREKKEDFYQREKNRSKLRRPRDRTDHDEEAEKDYGLLRANMAVGTERGERERASEQTQERETAPKQSAIGQRGHKSKQQLRSGAERVRV